MQSTNPHVFMTAATKSTKTLVYALVNTYCDCSSIGSAIGQCWIDVPKDVRGQLQQPVGNVTFHCPAFRKAAVIIGGSNH
jgi:hypothetical protein